MSASVRAAIYIRVSTASQTSGSGLDVQLAECRKLAERLDLEVVKVFQDDGVSGAHTAKHRRGLDQMLQRAEQREFEVVIVHHLDRLARELSIGLTIVAAVSGLGIRLIEASTGSTFADAGALQGLVSLWAAGEDRKRILQRTKRGHIERARKGLISGSPCLGYDNVEGRLVVNPEEAELVARIFRLYTQEGYNLDSLAALLNNEGILTKRARLNAAGKSRFRGVDRWQRSTIQKIIENSTYKGVYVYGKTQGRVPTGKQHKPSAKRPLQKAYLETAVKNREFLPHEVVEVPVPAIIDADLWEQAQQLKAVRYKRMPLAQGATKYTYNFETLVRCHHCGRVMTRMTMNQRGRLHSYYKCINREKACPNAGKHHRMERVDIEIMSRIIPYLQNPERVREAMASHLSDKQQEQEALELRRTAVEKRLLQLDLEVKRLVDAYSQGGITLDELKRSRAERDRAIDEAKAELATLDEKMAEIGYQDQQQMVDLVVDLLSQPGFQVGDPKMVLSSLFPNRVMDAAGRFNPKKMTVAELMAVAPAVPNPDAPDNFTARKFLETLNALLARVTVDQEGNIVDYKLKVAVPSPEDDSSDYKANLNSITSPS